MPIIAASGSVTMRQSLLSRGLDTVYLLAGYLAAIFLALIAGLMFAMSLGRHIGINVASGDDFAGWCMAAMAFLGLAHTFRRGDLLRIELLTERLPERARHAVEAFCLLLGTGLSAFMARNILEMTWLSYRFHDVSGGVVAVPLWIPQLGMSAGIVLITVAMLDSLVRLLMGLDPGHRKPKPRTREEFIGQVTEGNL